MPEISSRPMFTSPNSPTHRPSTFLDIILRPRTGVVKSYVRDDIDFLDHLPIKEDFDSTFISLDVTSLYTNIAHHRRIEAIAYLMENYPTYLIDTCFTKKFIIEGLLLVLKNN